MKLISYTSDAGMQQHSVNHFQGEVRKNTKNAIIQNKVLPGLEPGSSGSEPEVLTNFFFFFFFSVVRLNPVHSSFSDGGLGYSVIFFVGSLTNGS